MTPTPTSGAADLRTAAQAVVDRWDTPIWKDVPATAEYIGRLRAALAAGQATAAQAVAEPADTVVLNAAMRAIQQAIELIGAPTDERMRAVRRVLRGAVIVAEDDGKVAPLPSAAYAALPEPLEIDWPELHSQALGCGVEDRDLHNRYECAEYGWQDGVDKCAERVPEQIFDAGQMLAFADATCALRPSNGQAPAGANGNAELVTLIAECRDAFPIPAHGDPIENYWIAAIADPANVPAYLQEIAKRRPADSVLYDPKAVLDVFNSARAGSEKPVGYLRGILAVIAHWECRPEPNRWMVPVQADSVQEDAARLDFLIEQRAYVVSDPDACPGHWLHWARPDGRTWVQGDEHPTPRAAIDAARKQGEKHDR